MALAIAGGVLSARAYTHLGGSLAVRNIQVQKGWYLLGDGSDIPVSLVDKAEYAYQYMPLLNRYITIKPLNVYQQDVQKAAADYKPMGINLTEDSFDKELFGSVWLYFDEPSTISFTVYKGLEEQNDGVQYLLSGWNLKYINYSMIGKKFSETSGNCKIEKAYTYNPKDGWVKLLDGLQPIDQESLGSGFAVKVQDACEMKI